MLRFRQVFPRGKVFLPVIHVKGTDQALRNVGIALDNGGDGVFLIGHSMQHENLIEIYGVVRSAYPESWIGINFLDLIDLPSVAAAMLLPDMSGWWADDARIGKGMEAEFQWRILESERESYLSPSLLYFGGVHFKGGDQQSDPAEVARLAYPYMDVVTTSGPGTGKAADPRKIERMKASIGDAGILGLASGCTPENVADYSDYVDVFLVASSISDSFHELSPVKTALFSTSCR